VFWNCQRAMQSIMLSKNWLRFPYIYKVVKLVWFATHLLSYFIKNKNKINLFNDTKWDENENNKNTNTYISMQ